VDTAPVGNGVATQTVEQVGGSINDVVATENTIQTFEWPHVAENEQIIDSSTDTQNRPHVATVGKAAAETHKRPRVATPKAVGGTTPKLRKGKKSKVPEGYEARQRDNRFHLYRIHGYKLSANGKRMKNRSYIGSYTEKGLERFYEEQSRQLENPTARQHSDRVVEFDSIRSRRLRLCRKIT
jgi:hypothetical protein